MERSLRLVVDNTVTDIAVPRIRQSRGGSSDGHIARLGWQKKRRGAESSEVDCEAVSKAAHSRRPIRVTGLQMVAETHRTRKHEEYQISRST